MHLQKEKRQGNLKQTREYLGGQKFAHVLGYYDTVYGMSGLEKKFDKVLSGKENKPIKDYFNFNSNETRVGDSIVTTLDSKLQVSAFDCIRRF